MPDNKTTFGIIFSVETEDDGRVIAEITEIPGAMAYRENVIEAIKNAPKIVFEIINSRKNDGKGD